MDLKNIVKSIKSGLTTAALTGLAALVLAGTPKKSDAQSIEGDVNSSGSYLRPPIVNALVSAGSLGEDFTDIDGYYHIPPVGVIPPVQLHPQHGRQIKYGIFDILGRKVADTKNLESMFNNLSSGFYVLRAEEEEGIIQQKIIVNESDVIKGDKKYLFRFDNNIPVLNSNNSLKNNRSINALYEFLVDDDNIVGEIGLFYNYLDTLDITNNESKDVRLIPQYTIGTQYYDELLDLMNDLERPYTSVNPAVINNYGNYPDGYLGYTTYPQRVWLNEEQAYQYCSNPQLYLDTENAAIDSINNKTGLNLFTVVDDSLDANIFLNYTQSGSSQWIPIEAYINGAWHYVGGTVYLMNDFGSSYYIYPTFCHELGIHGLGMEGHSDDPSYISHGQMPPWPQDFQQEEIEAIKNHVLQYDYTKMYNFIGE